MDSDGKVNSDPRRKLPSVDRLIRELGVKRPDLPEWARREAARSHIEALREGISRGDVDGEAPELDRAAIDAEVERGAAGLSAPHPRAVLNATGVLLHTNLGRAPMADAAASAVARAVDGYSSLELDLETGRRGSRMGQLEAKLIALSGAEAAHVVNNCAAAVLLALNTLALGRAAVVSRGELVEIGGSFRVPSIMERAGVALHEIGTTNRTHLADYANALDAHEDAALLLKVHRSNFEQRGFVAEADVAELAELAKARGVPLVEDLGSGTLIDLGDTGLPGEAFAPGRLAMGVDVVCFSGDKLLGGPQAGILLGRRDLIDAMRKNPLARALRVDKLTVAALDATLDLMLDPKRVDEIPVVGGLRADAHTIEVRVRALYTIVGRHLDRRPERVWKSDIASTEVAVGGGSVPEHRLAGRAVTLAGGSATRLAEALRGADRPVLARVRDDAVWLDAGTLRERDLESVGESLAQALEAIA